jgi:predicted ATPase
MSHYLSILGEACTRAGKFSEARQALDEGLTAADKNDERYQEAELHRLKGELHLAETNDVAAAERCFQVAMGTARQQQSRAFELRAALSLARLWQQKGRDVEASALLGPVYDMYTEASMMPDLVEAKALLEQATNS